MLACIRNVKKDTVQTLKIFVHIKREGCWQSFISQFEIQYLMFDVFIAYILNKIENWTQVIHINLLSHLVQSGINVYVECHTCKVTWKVKTYFRWLCVYRKSRLNWPIGFFWRFERCELDELLFKVKQIPYIHCLARINLPSPFLFYNWQKPVVCGFYTKDTN